MKFCIAFVALIALCSAAPLEQDASAVVTRDHRTNDGLHGYEFGFDTSNGISRSENGVLRQGPDGEVLVVEGTASWTSPEGYPIQLRYVADQNGYQPTV